MTVEPADPSAAAPSGAAPLLARASRGASRASRQLATVTQDLALGDDDRLSDRERAALGALLAALAQLVERDIAAHALRALGDRAGDGDRLFEAYDAVPRLRTAGLLEDAALLGELLARVRQQQLSDALTRSVASEERPSLVMRLADVDDRVVASAAARLLAAENRRRGGEPIGTDLPAELHHKFVWWIAAVMSERAGDGDAGVQAIVDGARRCIASHDEGERLEAVALRLAIAIDARPGEVGGLLLDALGDGRLALFTSIVAHAARIGFDDARTLVLDRDGAGLWLALRAQSLAREDIARIGLALAEADPRRDLDRFADDLDAAMALDPATADATLAPLRLPADYRAARVALDRAA